MMGGWVILAAVMMWLYRKIQTEYDN